MIIISKKQIKLFESQIAANFRKRIIDIFSKREEFNSLSIQKIEQSFDDVIMNASEYSMNSQKSIGLLLYMELMEMKPFCNKELVDCFSNEHMNETDIANYLLTLCK